MIISILIGIAIFGFIIVRTLDDDGELTLLDDRGLCSKDQYKETMKISRKDGPKTGLKMLVFDYMPVANFKLQKCPVSYSNRRANLSAMFDLNTFNYFELLPLLYVGSDTSVISKYLDAAITDGQEGIMINIWDAPYEFKRTPNILKVKKTQQASFFIYKLVVYLGRVDMERNRLYSKV